MILNSIRRDPLLLFRAVAKTRHIAPVCRLDQSVLRLMSTEPPKGTEQPKPSSSDDNVKLPKRKQNLLLDRTPISWKSLGISVIVFGVLLNFLWSLKKSRKEELSKKKAISIGKAAIGGDFELIDTSKKVVTNKDFLGKWILIYFGFTHCPDICPEELEKMADVVAQIDKKAKDYPFEPLFISVDPERDTPELIAKYTADFTPRLRGLTGTIDQIKDVCKKFRIYYSAGPKEDGDYIVDHTIIMYLLNPKGEFQQYYGRNKNADEIARDIMVRMSLHKEPTQ